MLLKQFYPGCLARASYRIVDEATGTAVVVDSQRDMEQYLHEATPYCWYLDYVFLTHFHADFLAGPIELRDRVGATICLGTQAEFACTPFAHGDRLEFGHVRLEILETPGHTPEAIAILVYDLQQDPTQPHAGLTGDTLFIEDVGRPDLMASDTYIIGSLHLPLAQLQRQLSIVPRDRTVVLQCAGGYRSAIAASILAHHEMTAMADFVGGLAAWEAVGLDLVMTTVS